MMKAEPNANSPRGLGSPPAGCGGGPNGFGGGGNGFGGGANNAAPYGRPSRPSLGGRSKGDGAEPMLSGHYGNSAKVDSVKQRPSNGRLSNKTDSGKMRWAKQNFPSAPTKKPKPPARQDEPGKGFHADRNTSGRSSGRMRDWMSKQKELRVDSPRGVGAPPTLCGVAPPTNGGVRFNEVQMSAVGGGAPGAKEAAPRKVKKGTARGMASAMDGRGGREHGFGALAEDGSGPELTTTVI